MADQISALHEHLSAGCYSEQGEIGVILEELRPLYLFQMAAWPQTIEQVGALVAQATGASEAPCIGQSTVGDKAIALRVEPLKYWLISDKPDFSVVDLPSELACSLNLSHSRIWINIRGHKAEALLNHFLPVDLRDSRFMEGNVVSTAFHHVGVTLWRLDQSFNLLLPRSFSVALWQLLTESARQYGVDIKSGKKPK